MAPCGSFSVAVTASQGGGPKRYAWFKPSSLFSPGATQSYLAGTKNLNVSTNGNEPAINSPGYNPTTKKDTLSGVA